MRERENGISKVLRSLFRPATVETDCQFQGWNCCSTFRPLLPPTFTPTPRQSPLLRYFWRTHWRLDFLRKKSFRL